MNPRILPLLALGAIGCTPTSGSSRANLIGTHDLVLVDEATADSLASRIADPDGDGWLIVGVPSRYLFVTSADTNELRVLENFRTAFAGRDFLKAPNPLETLSIPVLDRPTMLAADEGRNLVGARVTGPYVYAARPGGAEVSVVSVARRRQLGGRPMVTPAPVTAISAFMKVEQLDADPTTPQLETVKPALTRLFVATWDGDFAAVYSAELATDSLELDHLDFKRQVLIPNTPITAMLAVAPLASRTLDGAPFCSMKVCLALATRANAGLGGQAILIDPETGTSGKLSFQGPVRDLTNSGDGSRIYGILDEQACGSASCGGVVAVDVATGTTSAMPPYEATFPASRDALGLPMVPMGAGEGLITGLTLASGGQIRQTIETSANDAGSGGLGYLLQEYQELGAYSSSSGLITFFSGLSGSVIDANALRSNVGSANVRLPGVLPDGGLDFVGVDGGVIGSNTSATIDYGTIDLSQTFRTATITTAEGAIWTIDVSDGYIETQSIVFVYQGQIPGLVALPTSSPDGVHLATGGYEVRAAVGDVVRFETGDDTFGYRECGRTRIAGVGSGFIDVAEVPVECASRVRFSVRADGLKPLVVAADLEGYMGRWAPGETLTYSRPYVLLPAEVTASRTALTINIPVAAEGLPTQEGAFTSIQMVGQMSRFQASLDTTSIGCYTQLTGQVVLGNMVMDRIPSSISGSSDIDFRWTLMGVVPSGNSVVEINLSYTRVGALGQNDLANCRR